MIKLILFDFDGTIADTLNAGLQIYNMNAENQGFKKVLNLEEAKKLSMTEFMQQFRIPIYKVPFLMRKVHILLNKDIHKMNMFKGMKTVVKELKKQYSLGILSSNAEKNIVKFLRSKNLKNSLIS